MIINVEARDIRDGVRKDNTSCPVAKALLRQTDYKAVFVYDEDANVYTEHYGDAQVLLFTEEVTAFIEDFDMGKPVEPFSFEIELP